MLCSLLDVVEYARVEPDSQVLGPNAELAESLDEVRKRREDQVEPFQLGGRGQLACDLADEQARTRLQRPQHVGRQDAEVLDIDDIRPVILGLGEHELRLEAPADERAEAPAPYGAVLAGPRALERLRIDHQLVRLVAELSEKVGVRVGSAEERAHQRAPLLVVAELVEPRVRGVVGLQECRIAGVDDQDAHAGGCSAPDELERALCDGELVFHRHGSLGTSKRSVDKGAELGAVPLVALALRRQRARAEYLEALEVVDQACGRSAERFDSLLGQRSGIPDAVRDRGGRSVPEAKRAEQRAVDAVRRALGRRPAAEKRGEIDEMRDLAEDLPSLPRVLEPMTGRKWAGRNANLHEQRRTDVLAEPERQRREAPVVPDEQ